MVGYRYWSEVKYFLCSKSGFTSKIVLSALYEHKLERHCGCCGDRILPPFICCYLIVCVMCLTKNAKVCKALSHGICTGWLWPGFWAQAQLNVTPQAGSQEGRAGQGQVPRSWLTAACAACFCCRIQEPACNCMLMFHSVRNSSTTLRAGAVQGCQTGRTCRSGLLPDPQENMGPFHHTSFILKIFY